MEEKYMLCTLQWVYDLERRKLHVFVKNSNNTKVKNLMTGEISDIPTHHGDYGTERRLDYNIILNTSETMLFDFDNLYAYVGTKAFATLQNEQKQVDKQTKEMEKHAYDFYPHDWPTIDKSQYMTREEIVAATNKALPILQQDAGVKKMEEYTKNKNSYEF